MLTFLLNFYRVKWIHPGPLFQIFLRFITKIYDKRGVTLKFQSNPFLIANSAPQGSKCSKPPFDASVNIYMLASGVDLECLPLTVPHASKAIHGINLNNFFVVVPDEYVVSAEEILSKTRPKVEILPDSKIVSDETFEVLRADFDTRAGWAYQQLLKLALLQGCPATYALIVDSDTVLLNSREWVNNEGVVAMTPTEEFNSEYFEFLQRIGALINQPTTSFVPHHMFFELDTFKQMLAELKLQNTQAIVNAMCQFADKSKTSPFSLDYELYSQWSLQFTSHKTRQIRWANISIGRKWVGLFRTFPSLFSFLRVFYNSVSFHSWN